MTYPKILFTIFSLFTGEHISHLGSVIDKLRGDITQLEDTVNNVKNTQQTVRYYHHDTDGISELPQIQLNSAIVQQFILELEILELENSLSSSTVG